VAKPNPLAIIIAIRSFIHSVFIQKMDFYQIRHHVHCAKEYGDRIPKSHSFEDIQEFKLYKK